MTARDKRTSQTDDGLQFRAGTDCQNRCLFCTDATRRTFEPLDDEGVRQALDGHPEPTTVSFVRKEPTLVDELPSWIRLAREAGHEEVVIVSNARRLADGDLATRLVEAGLSRIIVSLHGPTAEVHDRITASPGSFDEAVAGLAQIRRLQGEHPLRLSLVSTLCALNVDHATELARFVLSFEPDSYGFNALRLEERALRNADLLAVSYTQMVAAIAQCEKELGERAPAVTGIPACLTFGQLSRMRIGQVNRQLHRASKGRLFQPSCDDCAARLGCRGVMASYIDRFGWEEFEPLTAAEVDSQLPGPAPFATQEQLLAVVRAPADQWEILESKVSDSKGVVRLQAYRPDELTITLVFTPRAPRQAALGRSRRFNISLDGDHYSPRERSMAQGIITWVKRQERVADPRGGDE